MDTGRGVGAVADRPGSAGWGHRADSPAGRNRRAALGHGGSSVGDVRVHHGGVIPDADPYDFGDEPSASGGYHRWAIAGAVSVYACDRERSAGHGHGSHRRVRHVAPLPGTGFPDESPNGGAHVPPLRGVLVLGLLLLYATWRCWNGAQQDEDNNPQMAGCVDRCDVCRPGNRRRSDHMARLPGPLAGPAPDCGHRSVDGGGRDGHRGIYRRSHRRR